jgi:hypothetical protein
MGWGNYDYRSVYFDAIIRMNSGTKAWIWLGVYVVAADSYLIWKAEKTMSTVFGEALQHPAKRWLVLAVWGFLSNHLHRAVLPELSAKLDPLQNGVIAGEKVWYSLFGGLKSESN